MSMAERTSLDVPDLDDPNQPKQSPVEARAREANTPSSVDAVANAPWARAEDESWTLRPASASEEHALAKAAPPAPHREQPSGFDRAMGAIRVVLPVIQKILPLLDGNIASAVANILAPRPQASQSAADGARMENALAKLQAEQRELRDQVGEQSTSIKQVAEQLELVKEAADRNTQEQRELMEDLRSVRKKVLLFAWIGLGILAISLLVNVILYLHIERILP
jgi:hypothetical protein